MSYSSSMKALIKKILPENALSLYHRTLAIIASHFYRMPSKDMVVIGITGTKGKTSTANFIWSALQATGLKVGIISTANVRIGNEEMLNPFHMTMPGRFKVQKYLRQMADAKCDVAIVETTSQGLLQFRHIGIWYDIVIFTNLTPEHIDAHGSFDAYKKAKGILFQYLGTFKRKIINGREIQKTIITNGDSEHGNYFLGFPADNKITFSIDKDSAYQAKDIHINEEGVEFKVNNNLFSLKIPGKFNIYNALPAIIVGKILDKNFEDIRKGLNNISVIPGRMENINEGQSFKVIVDYAHEKQSMTEVLEAGKSLIKRDGKIIVILGAEGGGRDKSKGPTMGTVAGKLADTVVVSNTDPYDDDPAIIAQGIAEAAMSQGKVLNKDLFIVLDRREGIKKALTLASPNDVVIATGMGAQQTMIVSGKELPWDDRKVVREELRKL